MRIDEPLPHDHNGGPEIEAPDDYDRSGWIAIHRDIRTHWLVGFGLAVPPADPRRGSHSQNEAFTDLVMECKYKAGYINNGGRKMRIEPGQLVGAISWLANRWNWTPRKVRWFVDNLVSDGMITRHIVDKSGNKVTPKKGNHAGNQAPVLTICNYSKYQVVHQQHGQSTGQSDGNQPAINRQSSARNALISNEKKAPNKGTKEQYTITKVVDDAAREPNAPEGLAGLNGVAVQMIADVARWMNAGDKALARNWLTTTIGIFGHEVVKQAYQKLCTDLATGTVTANPLKTLTSICQRMAAGQKTPPRGRPSQADMQRDADRRFLESRLRAPR